MADAPTATTRPPWADLVPTATALPPTVQRRNKVRTSFVCPSCKGQDNAVTDSRYRKKNMKWRRRLCTCGVRFSTVEMVVTDEAASFGLAGRIDVMSPRAQKIIRDLIDALESGKAG